MSKAVLLSIRPEWCEKIANGLKTIEARKTKPKLETPFKCYIYCSLPKEKVNVERFSVRFGSVIGEFVCDKLVWVVAHPSIFAGHPLLYRQAIEDACLTDEEVEQYAGGKDVYGWHISDLVIYDKPKSLGEFNHCGVNYHSNPPVTRPPQSWCYVEELERKDGAGDEQ